MSDFYKSKFLSTAKKTQNKSTNFSRTHENIINDETCIRKAEQAII